MKFKEEILVAMIIILMIFLSLFPNIYSFANRHKMSTQRQWLYFHNYLFDHNSYLSKMKQGKLDRWTVIEKYTHESHKGSLYQILYLLLGKTGGAFGFSVGLTHFLARIFLGIIWLAVIYLFLGAFFKDKLWRLVCFLVVLLTTSFPRGLFRKPTTYYNWWNEFNIFYRPTFLPHFLVGHIAITASFFFFIESLKAEEPGTCFVYLLISGLLAAGGGLVLPPSLLVIYGGLIFFLGGLLVFGKTAGFSKAFKISLAVFLISAPALLYFLSLSSHYPWKEIADWEKVHPFRVNFDWYAFSQGITFFGAVLASGLLFFRFLFKKRELILFILVGWFWSHLFGLWFLDKTQLYLSARFWQVASSVPAGILTVYLVKTIIGRPKMKLLGFLLLALIFLGLLPGIYLNFQYVLAKEKAILAFDNVAVPYPGQDHYPLKTFMAAISWLGKNTEKEEIVLSHMTAGNFIPAYAGNTVYIGNPTQTVKIGKKYKGASAFFSGDFNVVEARDFLRKNNLGFVFWGPQERDWGGKIDQYPFLKPVYKNKDVIIFAVSLN